MTSNPTDLVYVDGIAVAKADVRSFDKVRVRQRMADPTEVRNTKLSGQFAGVYVRSLQNNFDLDATDTTTLDDSVNCIIDFDGNRFKRVGNDLSESESVVTAAGDVTIASDALDMILIKKTAGAATRVRLCASSLRTRKVRIVDRKYDAATNNITIVPIRPSTITMTIASPAVVALTANGRSVNDPISFETTGALPTGASPDTQYYVKTVIDADHFTFSATPGGSVINTSGSQSGVHTMGTDTIMGSASYIIDSNGAGITLTPLSDASGWV